MCVDFIMTENKLWIDFDCSPQFRKAAQIIVWACAAKWTSMTRQEIISTALGMIADDYVESKRTDMFVTLIRVCCTQQTYDTSNTTFEITQVSMWYHFENGLVP